MLMAFELFLIGVLACLCFVAAMFFLKFWRKTRDSLFLAFAASFLIRGFNDATRASMTHPNEGSVWSYVVGLVSSLLIVVAIIRKNVSSSRAYRNSQRKVRLRPNE